MIFFNDYFFPLFFFRLIDNIYTHVGNIDLSHTWFSKFCLLKFLFSEMENFEDRLELDARDVYIEM